MHFLNPFAFLKITSGWYRSWVKRRHGVCQKEWRTLQTLRDTGFHVHISKMMKCPEAICVLTVFDTAIASVLYGRIDMEFGKQQFCVTRWMLYM